MDPQDISAAATSVAQAFARAIAALDPAGLAPVMVVDSVLTANALKKALSETGWPGRGRGEPLPWCGTLDQAYEALANRCAAKPDIPRPRSLAMRRVQLAQALLDHRSIADSLGGSSRAALHLSSRWVDMFDGWEWLEMCMQSTPDQALADAPHLAADVGLLKQLHGANRTDTDRAAWVARYAMPSSNASASGRPPVWVCMGHSPSPKELAMASLLFGVPRTSICIWSHPAVHAMDDICKRLADAGQTPKRQMLSAQTMEESAWAAVQVIMSWRKEGIDDIGVVALDRKMLRRTRALLERAGEPFADRSGWALDTTVAASAAVGLNDLLTHQATTQSVLEWIHSPFVMHALQSRYAIGFDERRCIDTMLRSYGRVAPMSLDDLVRQRVLPFGDVLPLVAAANMRRSVSQWSGQLIHALQETGLEEALAQDAAGQSVLASIQMLHADAISDPSNDQSRITSSLWHALLNESLAQSRFVEPVADACVRVVSLASLSWQLPKAVLLLGADAQRLPTQTVPEFFEPKRFADMGLIVSPEIAQAEGFGQFAALWASPVAMACIACAEKPEAQAEFSNWIELLAIARPALADRKKAVAVTGSYGLKPHTTALAQRMPAVFAGELPEAINVTDLQKLIDCPYAFYLQTLLGLSPMQSLQEESLPTDLGSLVHQVLADAKMHLPSPESWASWLAARIDERLSRPFFVRRGGALSEMAVPPAIAAKLRADAMALVEPLSEWLFARTSAPGHGSPETLTEETVGREIAALGVTIKGRIDRWEKAGGQSVLIDFKTSDAKQLKKNIEPGDRDVQLPLYAWMIGDEHSARDAVYVSVRRDGVKEISLAETVGRPMAELTTSVVEQVSGALARIAAGEPLELIGMTRDKHVCLRCNVRGICRRDDLAGAAADDSDDGGESGLPQ